MWNDWRVEAKAQALTLTPSETVTVRHATEAALEVDVVYGSAGSPPPRHFHPAQDERFEVLEGELHVRVDGREQVLRAGDTVDIPRGAVHQMWNAGDVPARAVWATTPAGRTLDWFSSIDALHRSGRVGKDGSPGPLAFGVLLTEYRDVFRLAARPQVVVTLALRVLGLVGRARGYPGPVAARSS